MFLKLIAIRNHHHHHHHHHHHRQITETNGFKTQPKILYWGFLHTGGLVSNILYTDV